VFICRQVCLGQTNNSFTLSGTINADSGNVILRSIGSSADYPKSLRLYEPIPIKNGKFLIKGNIDYPIAVDLGLNERNYASGSFFIEPGNQIIVCNVDSLRVIPNIQNATTREYLQEYMSAEYQTIDTISDWGKSNAMKRRYLAEYARRHPSSWVALWEISFWLSRNYDKFLDSAYQALSGELKNSETGTYLRDDLRQLALTDTGKIFPRIIVIDTGGKSHQLDIAAKPAKYTLIDFWFSHCPPCLQQMPEYVKILDKYQSKGFRIIGVSTDATPANIEAWKKVIHSQSLNWLQFRADKKTMDDLRIEIAPYNFILDESGKIVAKDLETKAVSDFLQANLN
jgi:thiol-disulfide isomerase/thioredoxin